MDQELARYFITLEASVSGLQSQFQTLRTDFDGVKNGVAEMSSSVEEHAEKASISWQDMAKSFGVATGAIELAKKAFEELKKFVVESINVYDDEITTLARLKNQLGETSDKIVEFAHTQEEETRYSHLAYEQASALVAPFTKQKESIEALLMVAANYAAQYGMELPQAMNVLVRTLESTGSSIGRLHLGIEGAAGSQERINSIITKANEAWGDTAKIMADIGSGPMIIVKNQSHEIANAFGESLNPAVKSFAAFIKDNLPDIVAVFEALGHTINFVGNILFSVFHGGKSVIIMFEESIIEVIRGILLMIDGVVQHLPLIPKSWKEGVDSAYQSVAKLREALGAAADNEIDKAGAALKRAFSGGKEEVGGKGKPTPPEVPGTTPLGEKSHKEEDPAWMTGSGTNFKAQMESPELKIADEERKKQLAIAKIDKEIAFDVAKQKAKIDQDQADFEETLRKHKIEADQAAAEKSAAIALSLAHTISGAFEIMFSRQKDSFKEGLKSILETLVDFGERCIMVYLGIDTAKNIAQGPLGWIKAGGEIAAIKAAGALIKAAIHSFGEGGLTSGPSHAQGGTLANVEGGEYIVRGSAVSSYGTTAMEAVNQGIADIHVPGRFSAGGSTGGQAAAAGSLVARTNPRAPVIYNLLHDSELARRILATSEGKRGVLNHIGDNAFDVRQALGVA